ncbi:capsular associated protein [Podila minutissima]|uniref:Capsular associated protein n=1 Tax=Podila minutissima TaxID=64525 RepID=A0A9P5S9B5_9FUNG|nr:capsular associated protein [Podila minutissima]
MTAAYTPLSQRRDSDAETANRAEKPFRLSLPERQLAGLLLFFWLVCVWVALKVMEATHTSHHKSLLPTTNALLDTASSDIYQSLTFPLLQIANHTQLISNRCGTVSLPPHLLSFLDNDLHSQLEEEQKGSLDTPEAQAEPISRPRYSNHAQVESLMGAKASRYLFALVVQDAQEVLPDTLSRIIEAIAILGPNECHLSIVDHGSTDGTKQMIRTLAGYLDRYNHEQEEGPYTDGANRADPRDSEQDSSMKRHKQHISYTVITMASQDNSPTNLARVKNLALSPMFPRPSEQSMQGEAVQEEAHTHPEPQKFDRVVFFETAVVTCTEDILELVYQSQLQDADLVCGVDLRVKDKDGENIAVLDSSATRDILGKPLGSSKYTFSSDADTLARFKKRIPFQAAACWSGAVAIRASLLTAATSLQTFRTPGQRQRQYLQEQPNTTSPQQSDPNMCPEAGSTLLFNFDLWNTKQHSSPSTSSSTESPSPDHLARIVVVPTSQMQYSRVDYAAVEDFTAWGLWPKSEHLFRQEHEEQLLEASHRPQYGYSASTARYGFVPRVQEEALEAIEGDDTGAAVSLLEQILDDTDEELKAKLAAIGAVFGIRDIEEAVVAKRESELVGEWRSLTEKVQC